MTNLYLLFYSDGTYVTAKAMVFMDKDQMLCRRNHLMSLDYWVATAETIPGDEVMVFEQTWRNKQFMKEGY